MICIDTKLLPVLLCLIFELIIIVQSKSNREEIEGLQRNNDLFTETKNYPETKYMAQAYDKIIKETIIALERNSTGNNYEENPEQPKDKDEENNNEKEEIRPCTCGIFLSNKIMREQSTNEDPNVVQELNEKTFACTKLGIRQCQNECFQKIIKYLPKSAEILCASINEDIHKLKAHLFVQNCGTEWHNSFLAAGREYCCKNGTSYNCPLF